MQTRDIVLRHGEKVAIGLAIIIIIIGSFLLFGGEDLDADAIRDAVAEFKLRQKNDTLPALPDLLSLADTQERWEQVPSAEFFHIA